MLNHRQTVHNTTRKFSRVSGAIIYNFGKRFKADVKKPWHTNKFRIELEHETDETELYRNSNIHQQTGWLFKSH
jgi:hypothetical protein